MVVRECVCSVSCKWPALLVDSYLHVDVYGSSFNMALCVSLGELLSVLPGMLDTESKNSPFS